jgi:hypothetical protein
VKKPRRDLIDDLAIESGGEPKQPKQKGKTTKVKHDCINYFYRRFDEIIACFFILSQLKRNDGIPLVVAVTVVGRRYLQSARLQKRSEHCCWGNQIRIRILMTVT